ncbi:MAG: PfkB family carbohydrate kinase [Bifidobacteriaceae bacterium]|nr:PfkB family carbohydrate kinase [Bifidobacteriaceae bacterium]
MRGHGPPRAPNPLQRPPAASALLSSSPCGQSISTGSGDSFIATMLVGLLRGEDPQAAMERAARTAAAVCRGYGAFGHAAPIEPAVATAAGPWPLAPRNLAAVRSHGSRRRSTMGDNR